MVEDTASLTNLLNIILALPITPKPALYLDLEGINLSRQGSVSIISLYIHPMKSAYLIDVHTLGGSAFTTPSSTNPTETLKTILESRVIKKVFYDVRNDSDALFAHYKISLNGIVDIQLMELGARIGWKRFVMGLAKCITKYVPLTQDEKLECEKVKENGKNLFSPEKGGSYEVFNARPLKDDVLNYCVQDIVFLPILWETFTVRLKGTRWMNLVETETLKRVQVSQTRGYQPHGPDKALGPW
ncbi:ribonuclease H-like domain-containing protein [Xylogone sp. PMI_703]|nr:ribonuclease H-like domain-containing protein [Xylogone sp. PMI_703]